jgi:hypothetical protein
VQAESGARARAEQMLSRAREQAERTLAAAAAREAGAAQEAEQLLDDTKRAMVRAAADGEIALKAWCTEKVAEMDSRQADQEKWLGECQRAAAEAEQLSALLTQEAQRKAQEILDAAQEEVTALAEEGARLAEFVEHQAELGCAEIREHMEAIHEGIASLGEQLRERGAYLVSPDASYTAVG